MKKFSKNKKFFSKTLDFGVAPTFTLILVG